MKPAGANALGLLHPWLCSAIYAAIKYANPQPHFRLFSLLSYSQGFSSDTCWVDASCEDNWSHRRPFNKKEAFKAVHCLLQAFLSLSIIPQSHFFFFLKRMLPSYSPGWSFAEEDILSSFPHGVRSCHLNWPHWMFLSGWCFGKESAVF